MKHRVWVVLVAFGFLITGCAHQRSFAYHDNSEIPQGPGLFSGENRNFSWQFNHLGLDGANNSPSGQTDPNNGTKFSF